MGPEVARRAQTSSARSMLGLLSIGRIQDISPSPLPHLCFVRNAYPIGPIGSRLCVRHNRSDAVHRSRCVLSNGSKETASSMFLDVEGLTFLERRASGHWSSRLAVPDSRR